MSPPYLAQWGAYLRRKADEGLLAGLTWLNARQLVIRAAQRLDTGRTYRLNIGQPDRVAILLVGVGGTGSFAAHILAQLTAWALTTGLDLRLYYIDPDVVEERNLVRQNFCQAELGQAKAFTLAWRYSATFGLNITPVVGRFEARMLEEFRPRQSLNGTLTLVVGAVDNYQARRDIAEAVMAQLNYPAPAASSTGSTAAMSGSTARSSSAAAWNWSHSFPRWASVSGCPCPTCKNPA